MSRILLDTSGYAAFLRGHKGISCFLQEADEIFVNPIVLGELRFGFRLGRRRRKKEEELAIFLSSPRVLVADVDSGTSERYAAVFEALRTAGAPIPTNDVWIAASAMQHGLTVATTDKHFQRVPQILVELFEPARGRERVGPSG
ncbi:MAG: type II toxin-antitoxin system VapC family toxin [Thermoanaerobaculia bacterium]